MAVVSIDTGLLLSEVAALTFGCLDLDQGILRVLNEETVSKGLDARLRGYDIKKAPRCLS